MTDTLTADLLLHKMHAYWRASNYLSVGQIYLQDNPLLDEPLKLEHVKPRWLWGAVALSAALQVAVVHLPFLNLAFGTVPLTLGQWGVCLAMASGVLWASELRKVVGRTCSQKPARAEAIG